MTALVVGLTAVPALAFTWTVHPGGNFSGTDSVGTTVITDTVVPTSVTCNQSTITGTLNSGSGLAGYHIGTITSATFTGCLAGSRVFRVTGAGFPWYLNAVSYTSPVTSGRVTGIHLNLVASGGCSAMVDGTAATANDGKIKFRYSNADSHLKFIAPAVSLAFYSVTAGCGTLFGNTDAATYVASYPITRSQHITSP